jgi:hypothetical protein
MVIVPAALRLCPEDKFAAALATTTEPLAVNTWTWARFAPALAVVIAPVVLNAWL